MRRCTQQDSLFRTLSHRPAREVNTLKVHHIGFTVTTTAHHVLTVPDHILQEGGQRMTEYVRAALFLPPDAQIAFDPLWPSPEEDNG